MKVFDIHIMQFLSLVKLSIENRWGSCASKMNIVHHYVEISSWKSEFEPNQSTILYIKFPGEFPPLLLLTSATKQFTLIVPLGPVYGAELIIKPYRGETRPVLDSPPVVFARVTVDDPATSLLVKPHKSHSASTVYLIITASDNPLYRRYANKSITAILCLIRWSIIDTEEALELI